LEGVDKWEEWPKEDKLKLKIAGLPKLLQLLKKLLLKKLIMMLNCKNLMLQIRLN
jgi:hypothetical protein